MIRRLFLTVCIALMSAGLAWSQAPPSESLDAKAVERYVQAHPEHRSAFQRDGQGGILCTDAAIRAAVVKGDAGPAPTYLPTRTVEVTSEKKSAAPAQRAGASLIAKDAANENARDARITELEAMLAKDASDRELLREYKDLVRQRANQTDAR